MPTNIFQQRTFFSQSQLNILYSMVNLGSPRMITLDPALFTADFEGFRIVPAGSLIIAGNGASTPAGTTIPFGRVYPASVAVAAASGTTVTLVSSQSFKVGDVISKATAYYGTTLPVGTVSAVSANTNPQTLTLGAAATNAIAIGDLVFVAPPATAADDLLGLTIAPYDIGRDPNDVAGYQLAAIYRDRVPFFHSSFRQFLPGIVLCP